MVSIMVVGIIAVLVTLIVLAFAKLSNRELRQALDRQLSSQAQYAAETGLNDAIRLVQAQLAIPGAIINTKTNCDVNNGIGIAGPTGALPNGGKIGTDNVAVVTCVLVDPAPLEITNTNQTPLTTEVYTITNANDIDQLTFSWAGGMTSRPVGQFPTEIEWLTGAPAPIEDSNKNINPVVLRVSIYPAFVNDDRAALTDKARTYFLYPESGSGSIVAGTNLISYAATPDANNGKIINGNCSATPIAGLRDCNARINNLPGPGHPNSAYYVAVMPIYAKGSYGIKAMRGGTDVKIEHAQAVIDVTARGNDVLKRIQAKVNISITSGVTSLLGDSFFPSYSIESVDSICKRLIIPLDGTEAGVSDPSGTDNACKID